MLEHETRPTSRTPIRTPSALLNPLATVNTPFNPHHPKWVHAHSQKTPAQESHLLGRRKTTRSHHHRNEDRAAGLRDLAARITREGRTNVSENAIAAVSIIHRPTRSPGPKCPSTLCPNRDLDRWPQGVKASPKRRLLTQVSRSFWHGNETD
jgi:hypothetical protein